MIKIRLDHYLVQTNQAQTRSKAIDLIKRGLVTVNNQIITKQSFLVDDHDQIKIIAQKQYVSKGAYKLLKLIQACNITNFNDWTIADIGAATGGFSDVCLQMNAKQVYCIDVGFELLAKEIATNPKVIIYDRTNVKDLTKAMFNPLDLIVADLSFISIQTVFSYLVNICETNTQMMLLIKPQFELGQQIASIYKGVIKNKQLHQKLIEQLTLLFASYQFKINKIVAVDVFDEKKQNIEYMVHLIRKQSS